MKRVKVGFLPRLLLLCLALSSGQIADAQVREAWIATYPEDPFGTHLFASTLDHQGNPVVTGTSEFDFLTIKHDRATGQPLWVAREDITIFDIALSVAVDFRGDVYVTGFLVVSSTDDDFFTVKYESNTGQRFWSARYNGPANGRDRVSALAVDSQGDLLVVGSSTGIGTGLDYTTIKYDGQTGRPLWIARYSLPGNTNEGAGAVAIDREDNVFVTGNAGTIKYHGPTGQVLWGPIATGEASRIRVDPQGDVLVAGGVNQNRLETYKLSGRNGQLLWAAFSPLGVVGGARAIALDSAGDIVVAGGTEIGADGRVEKYSGQTGQTLWSRSLRGWCLALVVDRENDVYVTGSSYGFFPWPIGDFRTVKLEGRNGRLLWQRTYIDAQGRTIDVDMEGNLYVSGDIGPDQLIRYVTIKYEQAPPGDVNFDFCVNDIDLLRILLEFGQSGELPEDVNRDGVVDDQDLLVVLFNFGSGCGVE
jgi:hypothetical protein